MKIEEILIKVNRRFDFLIRICFSILVFYLYQNPFTLGWFYGIFVNVTVWLSFIVDNMERG